MPITARATQAEGQEEPPAATGPASGPGPVLSDSLARPGALASPAARLQAALGAEFDRETDEERWPLRWTVAAVFTTCGAFWMTVYFVVAALVG